MYVWCCIIDYLILVLSCVWLQTHSVKHYRLLLIINPSLALHHNRATIVHIPYNLATQKIPNPKIGGYVADISDV